jgi:F-type H+-transporting ATPase subunit delta
MAGDITTIARPYAEATFEVAKAHNALDAWSEKLALLGAIVEDPQISRRVSSPSVSRDDGRDLIFGIVGDGLTSEMQNLVRVLAANRRLTVMPEIARLFEQMKSAEQGLRHVHVQSAFEVSPEQQSALAAALKRHFGGDVELTVEQDESLIGGLRIRADDVVIDDSIRGKLQRLSNELQL